MNLKASLTYSYEDEVYLTPTITIEISVADPCLWLLDPDPDSAIFFIDLQDAKKKLFFSKFFCLLRFKGTVVHLHHFSKIKSPKEITRQ